jgi:hypothetical protein
MDFRTDVTNFVRSASERNKKNVEEMLERYHAVMKNLSADNNHIRTSRKINLDYCYTILMWILEAQSKKQLVVS